VAAPCPDATEKAVGWLMMKALIQRVVLVVAVIATAVLLPGAAAVAQEDTLSASTVRQDQVVQVAVSASARPTAEVCQDPPCTPPPPPDQRGTCVLTITRPHLHGVTHFRVDSQLKCVKGTGAPLVMRELTMVTVFKVDGVPRIIGTKGGPNRSSATDFGAWPHENRCKYYQGLADAEIVWPTGWVGDGDGKLSVRTENERWCT
jgi:hypothetical protein